MRRLILVFAMVAILGIGILTGSLLTPAAQADKKPVVAAQRVDYAPGVGTTPGSPYYLGTQYTYPVPVRWQVAIVPTGQPNAQLTVLIDTLTGDSFYLAFMDGRYFWSRITR